MKQFIITEQEKYNILKQYGLFEQGADYALDIQRISNSKPIGSYASDFHNLTGIEWEDFLKATYEPNFTIPYIEIRMSAMDIISILSNFFPGGKVISLLLDATSIGYFYHKNDKYEMGLRIMFLALPLRQILFQKFGKENLIKLINLLREIGEDYKILYKLNIEQIRNIISLFNIFKKNRNRILLALKESRLFAIALSKLVLKISALSLKQIIISLQELYKINPKNGIFVKGGKLLLNITTLLGEGFVYIKTWDALWNKFAPEQWVDEKIILDSKKRMDLQKELLSTLTKISENEINQYYNSIKS